MKGVRPLPVFLAAAVLGSLVSGDLHEPPRPAAQVCARGTADPTGVRRVAHAPAVSGGEPRTPLIPEEAEPPSAGFVRETTQVTGVIDGDTLVVWGNRSVRLLGVDTPERGKPFYGEAKDFLTAATRDRKVRLQGCASERTDKYGRLLAFVEEDGKDAGAGLLGRGLARTLILGPCARTRASEYRRLEREAFRAGRGLWSLQAPRRVPHPEAGKHVGMLMTVTGRVRKVFVGPRAVHLNFGPDYRTDFTAAVFRKDLPRLAGEGLLQPLTGYEGRQVSVTGVIREYNGPEIVIEAADQISFYPETAGPRAIAPVPSSGTLIQLKETGRGGRHHGFQRPPGPAHSTPRDATESLGVHSFPGFAHLKGDATVHAYTA